jgi:DNA-3-methyladenine glycosylase
MHWCFNAVTRGPSSPEAVLVRALRPLEGLERMRRNRGRDASLQSGRDLSLTNGPAKLCAALAIDGACDRLSLAGNSLFIERGPCQPRAEEIVASPRIGVDYAGAAAKWNLRFSLQGDAYVSKPQPWKAGDKATRGSPSDFFAF